MGSILETGHQRGPSDLSSKNHAHPPIHDTPRSSLPQTSTHTHTPHLQIDLYGASSLLPLTDEQLVRRLLNHLTLIEPSYGEARVVDSRWVAAPCGRGSHLPVT